MAVGKELINLTGYRGKAGMKKETGSRKGKESSTKRTLFIISNDSHTTLIQSEEEVQGK